MRSPHFLIMSLQVMLFALPAKAESPVVNSPTPTYWEELSKSPNSLGSWEEWLTQVQEIKKLAEKSKWQFKQYQSEEGQAPKVGIEIMFSSQSEFSPKEIETLEKFNGKLQNIRRFLRDTKFKNTLDDAFIINSIQKNLSTCIPNHGK